MKSHDSTGVVLKETPQSHCELNFEFLIFEHSEIFDCSRVFVTSSETTERAKRRRSLEGCAIRTRSTLGTRLDPDYTSRQAFCPPPFYQERDPRHSDMEKPVKVT